jgi:hypothetical protein
LERSSGIITSTARRGKNARSTIAGNNGGHSDELAISNRALTHTAARAINGTPANPFSPVQLGTAVNMNPAIALAMNPNSISCACHNVGGHPDPRGVPATKLTAHSGTNRTPATPARKKLERDP